MRSFKKALAFVLTLALVLSSMAVGFADTSVTATSSQGFRHVAGTKYESAVNGLADLGLVNGMTKDTFGVNANLNRAQVAKMIVGALGLADKANEAKGKSQFKDVKANDWFTGYVNVAAENNIVKGFPDGTFKPSDNVKYVELLAMTLRALGYDVEYTTDAVFSKAQELGIIVNLSITKDDLSKAAVRGDTAIVVWNALDTKLADGSTLLEKNFADKAEGVYENKAEAAVAALEAAIKDLTSDDKIAAAEKLVDPATAAIAKVKDVDVKADLQARLDAAKKAIDDAKAVKIASVTAVGAKKLQVAFNKAVDTTKASFTVKKASVAANVSNVTFTDDKKTATLELATKLTKGDYTVTVSGLSDKDLSATVTVDDEKVAKIEILSDTAAKTATGATVAYKVLNQYNEEITKTAPSITWTASTGTATPNTSNGIITLTGTYNKGDKVVLTGVEPISGVTVSKVLTIGDQSATASATVTKLYNADDKAELNTASNFSDFILLVDAKDQYGNKVTAAQFRNDMIVTSSNPTIVNVGLALDNQGPNNDMIGIPLAPPTGTPMAGTATIRLISKTFGSVSTFDVTVKKASTVDTFTISNPDKVVAIGETVEIPYTAVDQYGKQITSYSALNGIVTLSTTGGKIAFRNDYVNNKAVLEYTASVASKGNYVIMAVTPSGKVSQITIEVKDTAVPTVIGQVKDIKTALNKTATTQLNKDNIVVQDQYGRNVTLDGSFFANYKIKVEVADGNADVVNINSGTSAYITSTSDSITLSGVAKGSERIKLSLVKADNTVISGSEYEFTEKVVDTSDIADYKIADVTTAIYDDRGAGYTVDLDIYGVLSDGTKVVLPPSQYTVTSALPGLKASGKTLDANGVTFAANETEKKATIIIVIAGKDGPVTLTKEVTVSNVAPAITTLTMDSKNNITVKDGVVSGKVVDITVSNLLSTITAKDQYGQNISLGTVTVVFTNATDSDKDGSLVLTNGNNTTAAISGLEAGDSFNVTIITANGKTLTFKVVAEN